MKGPQNLTPKQKEILRFIQERIRFSQLPPTIREIAQRFNFSSTGTVRDYLNALVKKGYIKISEKKSRAIELVRDSLFRIPVAGGVTAGSPDLAVQDIEGYLNLDRIIFPDEDVFALRIKGDSMIGAGIMPGDLVLVKRQRTAQNADIVVALIDNEATVKILRKKGKYIYLKAANKRYGPILVNPVPLEKGGINQDVSIIGKVINVIRRYV